MRITPKACLALGMLLCMALSGRAWGDGQAHRLITLHAFGGEFGGNDGSQPIGSLLLASDGNFYGVTGNGGYFNGGTVFKITPAGSLTILHSFNPDNHAEGRLPNAGLTQASDGNFYGTTFLGGAHNTGTIFKITPDGTLTTLYTFSGQATGGVNSDGAYPSAQLVQDPDGNFYGTATGGGSGATGTIFKITPGGDFTTLYSFSPIRSAQNADGGTPNGLTLGPDGNFYGTAQIGGTLDSGTVFKITPTGAFTTLHAFTDAEGEGGRPSGPLVLASDGDFYGVTNNGGAYNSGTVYKITPDGTLTTLHWFVGPPFGNEGSSPSGALLEGVDGNFFGTSWSGGLFAAGGTLYRMTPEGSVTVLHSFTVTNSQNGDGMTPTSGLTQGADGNLYGTALEGGAIGDGSNGTVFCLNIHAVAPADFNGDGQSDLILQNPSTGQLAVWFLQGRASANGAYVSAAQKPDWRCVGTDDFNGDGFPDLVFQNGHSGQLAVWYLNSTTVTGGAYITPVQDPHWKAVAIADFNGDGKPDIVFQDSTTGQLAVWYMNGNVAIQGAYIYPKQDPVWRCVGSGDFDCDGHPDLLFENPSTGQLGVWYMDNNYANSAVYLPPNLPSNWTCVAVLALDNNSVPDLIIQNPSTGQLAYWLTDGFAAVNGGYLTPAPPSDWSIVGPH